MFPSVISLDDVMASEIKNKSFTLGQLHTCTPSLPLHTFTPALQDQIVHLVYCGFTVCRGFAVYCGFTVCCGFALYCGFTVCRGFAVYCGFAAKSKLN